MRILIAPDKFKGSLTSAEAAAAIETGFRRVFPDLSATRIPLADGGEGTAALFREALDGQRIEATVADPLGVPVAAEFTWLPQTRDAVIEMSAASGLWRLADSERNPLRTPPVAPANSSAPRSPTAARRILLGLGGSATNDAGAGLAAALGYRFLDSAGKEVEPIPANFFEIERIVPPDALPAAEIIALSDVSNPLLGSRGATRVYGPQKGATDLDDLEARVAHLARVIDRDQHGDHRLTPGAGAAGGLGFGLLSFFGAAIQPGFDTCIALIGIDEHLSQADLVLTGEGRLDASTLEGKGPAGIARLARAAGKPCIAFAGSLENPDALGRTFDACVPITDRPLPLAEAIADAAILLSRAAERTAKLLALSKQL